jgi:hypothetical protein
MTHYWTPSNLEDRDISLHFLRIWIGPVDPAAFLIALATTHDIRGFLPGAPKWASRYRNGIFCTRWLEDAL